jgi:hypothetical protein
MNYWNSWQGKATVWILGIFFVVAGICFYSWCNSEYSKNSKYVNNLAKSGTQSEKKLNNFAAPQKTKEVSKEPTPQKAEQPQTPKAKPYIPWTCTDVPIPRGIVYKGDSALDKGQTRTLEGKDGYSHECTTDSNGVRGIEYTVKPTDTIIYQGTNQPERINTPPVENDRNQKIAQCIQNLKLMSPNSSAWQQCYTMY